MDTKKEMKVVAFVFMLFAICIAEDQLDGSYILTCPRNIRLGDNNPVEFYNFGGRKVNVIIKLYYSESYNGNETLAQEQEYSIDEGTRYAVWDFYVKSIDIDNLYNGRLQIIGTVGDECINGSDKVNFSPSEQNIYLIQTDKPLYKPGQKVLFRVLKLDKRLRPSKDENNVVEISVEDPQATRLYQYNNVTLREGIVQLEFQLADEVVHGMWRIIVSYVNKRESQTFEVKEYVLPKFDVIITFPNFVLAIAEFVNIRICANYTYGKPVKGMLNVKSSLESYSYSRDKTPVLSDSVRLDGCHNYTLNISQIEPNNVYRYRRIMVEANVVEDGTDVQRNATKYLQRQYLPLNLNFNDQNYRQYFKPGLPYNGQMKVTNPDGSPAPGEPIELCATVFRKRVIIGWWASKEIKYCSNYTSDDDGYFKYTLSPQSTDCESVQLEAKSLKYARNSHYSGSRLDSLNQPSAGMTLSPFYSPSGSFIQLETISNAIPCGTNQNFKLLFTAKASEDKDTEFNLLYEIRKQGRLIQTGYQNVNFNIEDDVSDKFENDDELINGSETQIVPAPESTSSSDNDSTANDDDENCQSAKDVKYIPPIGEVHIPFYVNASLSPSFTLLVFYVRDDREVVADSQKMEVEKCFKNQVGFEFGDEIKQPGTKTSITVKSSPNSLCGIKVVDKSVSLLNSNNQLTKEKIFQILESLDSSNYYAGNPCNEQIPQPGLYSSKASIIRPPGHWTSSSYQDSLSSFQDANMLVISNCKLFTRPCRRSGEYGGGPIFQAESFSANAGHAVALASTARRPAAPAGAFAADAKIGDSSMSATKSAVDVRNYFPETWLFELEATGPDGVYISKETLPHTITEWEGSAVCVSSEDGLGLSNTTTIKGFQAFFISYTLPYSVIRGEEFYIVVSIFSYVGNALPITVSLDKSEEFIVTSDSIDGNICVKPDTSENLRIKVKATTLGTVNITVRAQTADSNDVCGDSTVYDGLAKDAITQSFEVEAEGFPVEKCESILFCPTDEEDQTFRSTLSLILPENVVPDSARAIVDVTGNVMGPAIKNLDNLVSLPTGCGEQNMVKFTPNYVVLDYLSDIGKLTENIKNKAIRNLLTGYQRELTYRHQDGSFSAFGEVDKEGSMFLTAFVLKSFKEAKRYISIDDSILTSCQNWIVSKQQADGCFPNFGKIVDRGIQGGLEKEKNAGGITAYVVSALLISGYENKTVINNAMGCLREDSDRTPYNSFICAYAEALAGETEAARKRMDDVRPIANKTGGIEYYKNPNGTQSLDLETAAYAVLAQTEIGKSALDVLGLIRYMSNNLSPRGGFYSTQDTCVGLDALSKFAKKVYADPVDIEVSLSGVYEEKFEINEDNKLLVQRNIVSDIPGDINTEATGSGCGLIQAVLRYNTNTPPEKQSFYLEVVGRCTSSDCKQRKITVIISFIPKGKSSGMSVIQIQMMSGTVAVRESIDKLKADKNNQISRVDVEENSVVCYVPEVTNDGMQLSFRVEEVVEFENPQPGLAKVYDYYSPELSATTSFSFGNSDISGYSPESGSTEP